MTQGFLRLSKVGLSVIWLLVVLGGSVRAANSRDETIRGLIGDADTDVTYHALIIGINDYREDGGWSPLVFPESDAARVGRLLKESYGITRLQYLSSTRATCKGIMDELARFKAQLDNNDALIVFYAGHGYRLQEGTGKGGYWIPQDGTRDYKTWLSLDELHNFLMGSKARHILLISDSCYAGAFFTRGLKVKEEDAATGPASLAGTVYARQILKPSRFIVTSGDFEQVPDKSVFTERFISILEGEKLVFSGEDVYFRLKGPVYRETGTHVLGKEMLEKTAGGNFIFIQHQPIEYDTTLVLHVTPPYAEVLPTTPIHHVSERVLNEFEEKVGEHWIRFKPGQESTILITSPGYHDRAFTYSGKPRQKRKADINLREWVPARLTAASGTDLTPPAYRRKEPSEMIVARAPLARDTWKKGEPTCTTISPSGKRTAVASYVRDTNLRAGRRHSRVYAGIVYAMQAGASEAKALECYPPAPKAGEEKSSRHIRDVLFLRRNERFLVALAGDHLFLWDVDLGVLLQKELLAKSLKSSELANLSYYETGGRSFILVSAEKTKEPPYEISF